MVSIPAICFVFFYCMCFAFQGTFWLCNLGVKFPANDLKYD